MSRKKAVFLYESKRMRWFALAGIIAGGLFTILMMHEFKGPLKMVRFIWGEELILDFVRCLGARLF